LIWFFILKPAVHDTAVNANKEALAAQQAQTDALKSAVTSAQDSANAANTKANVAIAAATGKPAPSTTTTTSTTIESTTTTTVGPIAVAAVPTTVPPPVTSSTDSSLEAVAAPGSTAFAKMPAIAKGTTLTLNDIVIQNISGSVGTARIERLVPGKPPEDLLIENLGQLKDQEYTFNTPLVFTHDEQLQLRVDCAGDQTACDVGLLYTGQITQPQSATTTTIP